MAVVSSGTTIIDNGAFDPAIPTGSLVLIKSITASSSASIEFINGTSGVVLDGTYDSYIFSFINCHPQSSFVPLQFNASTDAGSNYNVTKTTTKVSAYHNEAGNAASIDYQINQDLAQSTSFQDLIGSIGNGADESCAGVFQIFNPSSTTYVKHFISRFNGYADGTYSFDEFVAGYLNTTSAINAIKFQFSSGNIDDGIIKMYGVK